MNKKIIRQYKAIRIVEGTYKEFPFEVQIRFHDTQKPLNEWVWHSHHSTFDMALALVKYLYPNCDRRKA